MKKRRPVKAPVVVPLDGSVFAEIAIPMGRLLAQATGSPLHLVHVMTPPVPNPFHPEEELALEGQLRSRSLRYLKKVARGDEARAHKASKPVVLSGDAGVAKAAAEYAAKVGASWIVLTTHGAGGLSRWLRGSVADGLARLSVTPLLFLRPWDPTGNLDPGERRLRKILVPLDGSAESESALAPATALARVFEVPLVLMQVVPPRLRRRARRPDPLLAGNAALDEEAMVYLQGHVEYLKEAGLEAEVWQTADESVATGILTATAESGCDLIVMATHGRGGAKRLMLGSVADRVLQEAVVPLALVRPAGTRRRA